MCNSESGILQLRILQNLLPTKSSLIEKRKKERNTFSRYYMLKKNGGIDLEILNQSLSFSFSLLYQFGFLFSL